MSRKKSSGFHMIIELAAMLPYWLGLLIAAISYFALHTYASSDLKLVMQQGRPPMLDIAGTVFKAAARVFQYIIPVLLVFGTFIKAVKAFQGKKLAERYVTSDLNKSS